MWAVVTQGLEIGSSSKKDTQENVNKAKVLAQRVDTTSSNPLGGQTKAQIEALLKRGWETPFSTPNKSATNTAGKHPSTEIRIPIKSVTTLQSSQRIPNAEFVFIEDITLILAKEITPSNFFFSNKRRAIVKRETH
jgi:hypothetical protein